MACLDVSCGGANRFSTHVKVGNTGTSCASGSAGRAGAVQLSGRRLIGGKGTLTLQLVTSGRARKRYPCQPGRLHCTACTPPSVATVDDDAEIGAGLTVKGQVPRRTNQAVFHDI